MKEIVCKSGAVYGLEWTFGSLKGLDKMIFEAIDDDKIAGVRTDLLKANQSAKKVTGKDLEDLTDEEQEKYLSGETFKTMIRAGEDGVIMMCAKIIRTMNGESVGDNFAQRLDFCQNMNFDDGEEISDVIAQHLQNQKDKRAARLGESVPTSMPDNGQVTKTASSGLAPSLPE